MRMYVQIKSPSRGEVAQLLGCLIAEIYTLSRAAGGSDAVAAGEGLS